MGIPNIVSLSLSAVAILLALATFLRDTLAKRTLLKVSATCGDIIAGDIVRKDQITVDATNVGHVNANVIKLFLVFRHRVPFLWRLFPWARPLHFIVPGYWTIPCKLPYMLKPGEVVTVLIQPLSRMVSQVPKIRTSYKHAFVVVMDSMGREHRSATLKRDLQNIDWDRLNSAGERDG